ncbi:MAG: hypothetical protein ACYTHK_11280 [Planctomycetota bacterium]|jgi:hypothetical protein
MRKDLWAAVLGFLVGAAAIAGGDDEDTLREELRRLQREAARAAQKHWESDGRPPSDDAGNQIAVYPMEDLIAPLYDELPMSGEYLSEGKEYPVFGGQAEEGILPFGTIEEIAELARTVVDPAVWEETASLAMTGQSLVSLAPPATNGRVRELLDRKLRPLAHQGVSVEFEVVELPGKLLHSLRTGTKPLTNAQRTALDEAIRAGTARRVIALRGSGTLGTRFSIWHGKQVALRADSDVEVAQTASTADPVIQIGQAGGWLGVRAERGDSGNSLKLDLRLRLRELKEVRRHETDQAGVLDLPTLTDQNADVILDVTPGAWNVAGAGGVEAGRQRVFLVRASALARGGVR